MQTGMVFSLGRDIWIHVLAWVTVFFWVSRCLWPGELINSTGKFFMAHQKAPAINWRGPELSHVQTENVVQPNAITHCLMTKHVDEVLSGQTILGMFDHQLRSKWTNCFTVFDQSCPESFKFHQTLTHNQTHDQTRCPNGKMLGHQTMCFPPACRLPHNLLPVKIQLFVLSYVTIKYSLYFQAIGNGGRLSSRQ